MAKNGTTRRPKRKNVEISTFANAVRHLMERPDLERMRTLRNKKNIFKLDRSKALLAALDDPQDQAPMVHVAGTVGKGSTVAMIASMLEGCGYTVGRYTSPHLLDVRERVTINDQMVSRPDFTALTKMVAEAAKESKIDPTYFEMLMAMAFKYFEEQAVDIAIVETGLGGRLDSTNVITPELSIITQIDYDHEHILGDSLKKIAREKAGIFKRGVPALTCMQPDEVLEVLHQVAEKVGAPLQVVGDDIEFSYRFGVTEEHGPHCRVCLVTETNQFMHLPSPLPGEHQAINCGLALAAIDILSQSGFEIEETQMYDGLAQTHTPGRMEMVWNRPRILIDGAHNAAALSALIRCVGAHIPYDSVVCIFGCCEDKDLPELLHQVARSGDKIIFTRAKGNPRAADPEDLQRQFSEITGKMSQVASTVPEALDLATKAVGREDLICVTGSFYLAGEAKKYLMELDKKKKVKV